MDDFGNVKVRNFSSGDIVIREGEKAEDFFIILSGQVDVIITNSKEKQVVVASLKEGEVFGELGIILGLPRQATIRAKTNLEVEVINPRLFSSYFNFDKEIGEKMRSLIQTMAVRIRETGLKLAEAGLDFYIESKEKVSDPESSNKPRAEFIAVSNSAVKALNGIKKIEIVSFPFRVGRYSKRSSDRLFHKNDLYLFDKKPYVLSRSHFSIVHRQGEFYIRDSGSSNGCIVNGTFVRGYKKKIRSVHRVSEKKVILQKGENDIYLGSKRYNLHFKIITYSK